MVHGTPGKPEAFLNAEQTEAFSEIMGASGKTSLLENIKNTLQTLEASSQGTVSSGNALASNSSIVINPGAVVIEVAKSYFQLLISHYFYIYSFHLLYLKYY